MLYTLAILSIVLLWIAVATLHRTAQPTVTGKLLLSDATQLPTPQLQNTGRGSAANVWIEVETMGANHPSVTYFLDTIGTLNPWQSYTAPSVDAGGIQEWFNKQNYISNCVVRMRCSYGDSDRQTLEQVYILSRECGEGYRGEWVLREMLNQPAQK